MRHWISMLDWEPQELAGLVDDAIRAKRGAAPDLHAAIRGRILVMLFFNPSLRTRTSFEAAMLRHDGHAVCLNAGSDTWALEHRDGVVMDGPAAEHVREAVPVLGRYGDALAVRSFAGLRNFDDDAEDALIRAFERHSTVPVINMESASEHPCQGLADWMTMVEKIGDLRGKRFALSWAPHIKPLPMAVPHSAILAAAAAGMQVTVAHPRGYDLNPEIVTRAASWCAASRAEFTVTNSQQPSVRSADVVYAKSWGAAGLYGDAAAQAADFRDHAGWQVTAKHLGPSSRLMHCLPVRRNVVIADDALDDPRCVVVDQAENRLWAQTSILARLLSPRGARPRPQE